jgi:hypothetical protein
MLHLYVYDPQDDFDEGLPPSALRVSDYLKQRPNWVPALEETWLGLNLPGGEHLLELNPFGLLNFLVPQLEAATKRLEADQRALIRSAGDWTPVFLVLEPKDKVTLLSALSTIAEPWGGYYPLTKSPLFTPESLDQREALYTYVEENRELLRPGQSESRAKRALQGVELPTDELVQSLREEAHTGRHLLEILVGKGEK